MYLQEVYVGLGGNIGDSYTILQQVAEELSSSSFVQEFEISRFYCTTPVSSIPQNPYINAVCRFKTALAAPQLLQALQEIEKSFGKMEKIKEAPRVVDLDILFFGFETYDTPDLQIPHPHWCERLFVIAPLADLTTYLTIPDSKKLGSFVQFKPNLPPMNWSDSNSFLEKITSNMTAFIDGKLGFNVKNYLLHFPNIHQETVIPITGKKMRQYANSTF